MRAFVVPVGCVAMLAGVPAPSAAQSFTVPSYGVFRNAFVEVMRAHSVEWRLQPELPRAPDAPPLERMVWQQGERQVTIEYARYLTVQHAQWDWAVSQATVSIGTPALKGLADEAWGFPLDRRVAFRRGSFLFRLDVFEPITRAAPRPSNDGLMTTPPEFTLGRAVQELSRLLVDAVDRTLAAADSFPPEPSGDLLGCVTDATNSRLPGVRVITRSLAGRWMATTDADGCYRFAGLPADVYRVTATLEGFANATSSYFLGSGRVERRMDLTLRVSPICDCIGGPGTLAELWNRADTVVHLRIEFSPSFGSRDWPFFVHAVTVLDVLKSRARGTVSRSSLAQWQRNGEPEPYYPGEEYVMFITADGQGWANTVHEHHPWVMPVSGGTVRVSVRGASDMPIADFIRLLRSMDGSLPPQ